MTEEQPALTGTDIKQRLPDLSLTQATRDSVQDFAVESSLRTIFLQLVNVADEAPQWWSPRRDVYLDRFWPTEPFLAGALFSVCSRNASFRYEFTGPRRQVRWAQQLFAQADFGRGWQSFMMKVTLDYLTMGNGAYVEVIRPARITTKSGTFDAVRAHDPITGKSIWHAYDRSTGELTPQWKLDDFTLHDSPLDLPVGLSHLDSMRCHRTGNPAFPAIYTDNRGRSHRLAAHQVIMLEEMPSPREEWFGVQHCLHRDATVHMADGSTRRIVDLVRSKSTEHVLTMGDNGNVVSRPIIGWYENKRGNRKWVNIRGKNVKSVRGWSERNSWVTDDHPVLTPGGWVNASELKTGDLVVTRCPAPNDKQLALMVGTLLGDGCMAARPKTARMSIGHHISSADWLYLKTGALSDFNWRYHRYKEILHAQTRAQPAFNAIRKTFYPNGKRAMPLQVVERFLRNDALRPILLVSWYLDDGHIRNRNENSRNRRPSISIGCVAADPDEVRAVVSVLNDLGYRCSDVSTGIKKYPGSRNILFSVDASARLFGEIAPYVPLSMRYKLPADSKPFDEKLWDFGHSDRFADEVVIKYNGAPWAAATYCIDVADTHNFITSNIVVHNCAVDRSLLLAQTLRDILVYKNEKISGRFARAVHITNADADTIQDAVDQANTNADNLGLRRYTQPVVASTVHPEAKPSVMTIELASLPDGFDEEVAMRWYIAGLAMDLGVDFGFLAPLPGNKLGTSEQAETAERQARGKSSRLFMSLLEYNFNYGGILPRNTTITFNVPDPFVESERDRAFARRARARSTMVQSGEITPQIAAQIAADQGDLDPKYLVMMGLADLTPVVTVGGSQPVKPQRFRPVVRQVVQQIADGQQPPEVRNAN